MSRLPPLVSLKWKFVVPPQTSCPSFNDRALPYPPRCNLSLSELPSDLFRSAICIAYSPSTEFVELFRVPHRGPIWTLELVSIPFPTHRERSSLSGDDITTSRPSSTHDCSQSDTFPPKTKTEKQPCAVISVALKAVKPEHRNGLDPRATKPSKIAGVSLWEIPPRASFHSTILFF
jgi:hypothetical protein